MIAGKPDQLFNIRKADAGLSGDGCAVMDIFAIHDKARMRIDVIRAIFVACVQCGIAGDDIDGSSGKGVKEVDGNCAAAPPVELVVIQKDVCSKVFVIGT